MANSEKQFFKRSSSWKKENSAPEPIDLFEILKIIKRKLYIFIILAVLGGVLGGLYTKYMVTPMYSSTGTIFLTPTNQEIGSVDYGYMTINSRLVKTVTSLMTKDNVLSEVAERVGLPSAAAVRSTLGVSNEEETEIIYITSITTNAELSKNIVAATIDVFIEKMQQNLKVDNIEIVDHPKLNFYPIGVNYRRTIGLGALSGACLAFFYVMILYMTDNRLKTKDEAEKYMEIPVIVEIPKFK